MSEEKNGDAKGEAMLGVSFELLHSLLRLPPSVTIVMVAQDDDIPPALWNDYVTLELEGDALPCRVAGSPLAIVKPVYEHAQAVRFLRFERINDA